MAEPNHEDMEQQVVVPEGATSSKNVQASSHNTFSDPTLARLQEELAQAWLERETLEEDIVPRRKYQELQQQMNIIHEAEVEAHEKCRKVEGWNREVGKQFLADG